MTNELIYENESCKIVDAIKAVAIPEEALMMIIVDEVFQFVPIREIRGSDLRVGV